MVRFSVRRDPGLEEIGLNIKEAEQSSNGMVNHILDCLRLVVEGCYRRCDDCPGLCCLQNGFDVSSVQRGLA